jgi:hypothetical protein
MTSFSRDFHTKMKDPFPNYVSSYPKYHASEGDLPKTFVCQQKQLRFKGAEHKPFTGCEKAP